MGKLGSSKGRPIAEGLTAADHFCQETFTEDPGNFTLKN